MSIANEIQRIQTAKADLKTAIESRGLTVGENTIDKFADVLSDYPYIVKGTFTAEQDAKTFSITTPFAPQMVILFCDKLLQALVDSVYVNEALPFLAVQKSKRGIAMRMSPTGANFMSISSTSNAVNWEDAGFIFQLSESTLGYFKSGYIYDYYVAGGFAE